MKLLPSISKSSEYFTALTTEVLENEKTSEMRTKEINQKKSYRTKPDIFSTQFYWIACQSKPLRRNVIRSHIFSGFKGKQNSNRTRIL